MISFCTSSSTSQARLVYFPSALLLSALILVQFQFPRSYTTGLLDLGTFSTLQCPFLCCARWRKSQICTVLVTSSDEHRESRLTWVGVTPSAAFEKRQSKSLRGTASEDALPAPQPRMLRAHPQDEARDVSSPWPNAPRSAPCRETTCRTPPQGSPTVFCRAFQRVQGTGVPYPLGFLQNAVNVGTCRGATRPLPTGRHGSHQPGSRHGARPASWARRCPCPQSWCSWWLCHQPRDKRERPQTPQRTRTPQHMLHGGGHWDRVDGDTSKHGWTKGRGGHKRRRRRTRNTCTSKLDWRATGQHVPVTCWTPWATPWSAKTGRSQAEWPKIATHVWEWLVFFLFFFFFFFVDSTRWAAAQCKFFPLKNLKATLINAWCAAAAPCRWVPVM